MFAYLGGKEPAPLSIFFDKTNTNDFISLAWREVIFSWTSNIEALCCRQPLESYELSAKTGESHRISFHDFFSDPLSWFTDCPSWKPVKEECCRPLNSSQDRRVIFIDDLLLLGRSWNCIDADGCWDGLIELLHDMSRYNHVVVFVHPGLVSDANIRILMHIAQFYATIEDQPDISESYRCHSVLCKASGKVSVDKKTLSIDKEGKLHAVNETVTADNLQNNSEDIDPASNLTFNLRLSETEKVARANTSLPYLLNESKKNAYLGEPSVVNHSASGGEVIYLPDESDDFDDEDPDDDLDF